MIPTTGAQRAYSRLMQKLAAEEERCGLVHHHREQDSRQTRRRAQFKTAKAGSALLRRAAEAEDVRRARAHGSNCELALREKAKTLGMRIDWRSKSGFRPILRPLPKGSSL